MARDEDVSRIRKEIEEVLEFRKDTLIHRPKWGEITFESAERDYDRVFDVLNNLKIMPLEYLTDNVIINIVNEISHVKAVFEQIDKFNIQVQNPAQIRDELINNVHSRTDNLYSHASPWIPFLAYQKGDVARNIKDLTTVLSDANIMIEKAKTDIDTKKTEIDGIVVQAREASAAAGAAIFTQDFQNESILSADRAKPWLFATIVLATSTLIAAVLMWIFTEAGLDQHQIWQKLTTKLAILALLISATAWCGKIYKAFIHQSIVSRHRALSLQTFQAFSAAASDIGTKDAVLIQTTRSIFSDAGTGFIDGYQRTSDSDIKVLEVLKSILPKSDGK